jgi:hypothetical protein
MGRDDSAANPAKREGEDDANANPGTGASGPGERAWSEESQVSGDDGEAAIEADEQRAAMAEDPVEQDPARQADG